MESCFGPCCVYLSHPERIASVKQRLKRGLDQLCDLD